jgi:cytochrome b561
MTILLIPISGILKKLYNGESLIIFFKEVKIQDNFDLAEIFYNIHIISNYLLIALITIHILAVIVHKLFFNDNLIKKIL